MTSYEKYRKSLEETPGPTQPPADRTYNLRGLYDYIKKTGRDCSELTDEEKDQFVVPLGDVTKGVSEVCKVMEDMRNEVAEKAAINRSIESAREMLKDGISVEKTAQYSHLSIAMVEELKRTMDARSE